MKFLLLESEKPCHIFQRSQKSFSKACIAWKWQLLSHPLYCQDLAYCDFYLFPQSKKGLLETNMRVRNTLKKNKKNFWKYLMIFEKDQEVRIFCYRPSYYYLAQAMQKSIFRTYADSKGSGLLTESLDTTECISTIRKHTYSNILKILQPKKENFQIKNSDIFHIPAPNIDCSTCSNRLCEGVLKSTHNLFFF